MTLIFDLIIFLVIGLVAGAIASFYMGRQQELVPNLITGTVGAFIGGFLFNQFGSSGVTGFNIWSLFVAFTGAVVLLAVIRLLSGRRVFSR